ncbi:M16 family metallopeptidase [Rhodopirellula sp. MGV]|uniref:M16 family metallopeptidase n=1 Tax=Rhodopirellula sp. MGV TaxID=2023130 RepID=UPI000B96B0E2|nr:pitrilysin family protein [Rhodopirellula sp. MGV]OYP38418.1 peptidase M16 [Rhodopirellula sp. MGV]PNY34229.1 insulinase family protein [Rhodopirellula baltica]
MPEFKKATLKSGLRIVAETDPRSYSMSLGYFVRAGARNERDPQSGLSHFLEHMMFKGTKRRSAEDVNRELDELGGQSNAYTSEEQTVYYATVLPKFQDRIVDLLTDMMSPVLDEGEFETERQVILEEIAKYEDQPPFGGFERAMEVFFSPRGLGRRVLGTPESIEAMTAARMRDYFLQRYRPENIVVAASGNVDFDSLVSEIEQRTGDWASRLPVSDVPDDDLNTLPEGIQLDTRLATPDASQAYAIMIGDGPSSASPDRYAARLLASVLGDEGGSRMFWDLIDTGRAEIATCWPQEFSDCGSWFTYLVCAPEDLQSNKKFIQDIVTKLLEDGVGEAELRQAINKTTAGYIMQSERPSNRLFSIGSRTLMHDEYMSLDATLDRIKAVDENAISRVAKEFLSAPAMEIIASAASDAEDTSAASN